MKPEEHHRTSVLIAALPPWSPTSPVRVARFLLTGRWQVVHAYGIITSLVLRRPRDKSFTWEEGIL